MKQVQEILYRMTTLLCQFLDPSQVLLFLKTRLILTDDDVRAIKSHPSMDERVDYMLVLLKQRGQEAYFALMEALRAKRQDLFQEILNIESTVIMANTGKMNLNVTSCIK